MSSSNSTSSKSKNSSQDEENDNTKQFWQNFILKTKKYIYHRNYLFTSKSSLSFLYAFILNSIYFLQSIIFYSLPQYNQAIKQGSDIYFIVSKGSFLLLKFQIKPNNYGMLTNQDIQIKCLTNIVLCLFQVSLIIAYLIPIKSKQLNLIVSKYFIHPISILLYLPSILLSTQNILAYPSYMQHNTSFTSPIIYISLITLTLTLINRLIFICFHFQFSIQGQSSNILIRNPQSSTKQIINFIFVILLVLCRSFIYPMSLIAYFIINICLCLIQVKQYCIGYNYHHQAMTKLFGINKIMNISIYLCYLIIITTNITLVAENVLTFIVSFFLFFSNFFLVFKKFTTKNIVIDSSDDNQTQNIIFIMWYFNCFRNRANKKSQLYLSSLLKNHSTKCFDLQCCCRNRTQIYDPNQNIFGMPQTQPHQDIVYIKHFFLKLLADSYKKFPKCNQILFLLAFYNLQILNFIPQTIELIKVLKKKSSKNNLTYSQDYLLYCLTQRCFQKILQINQIKGDLDLQKAKNFDMKMLSLKDSIKYSVKIFSSLWKFIYSQKYNQQNLVEICKIALQVMFKIQENYKDIKKINNVSTQLKEIMFLYSKFVAHDIHLLSEIRKQIKTNSQTSFFTNSTQIKAINIFSPDTICLITSGKNTIRWASKNCSLIFGYQNRQQFLKLRINDLMPKYFSQNHDKYIKKWLQTGYSSKLNKSTYLWCTTKQGHCFSVAIYIKIIPLEKEQDFAMFSAIEKIDIQNQIICSEFGQIYGCGKNFSNTIKCSQKYIQDYQPNIQILIPSMFQIFFKSFYPSLPVPIQSSVIQVRKQGYFPKNLQNVFKLIIRQKQQFIQQNSNKATFNQLFFNFLKQKMQQITVFMDGQYISFTCFIHYLPILNNKKTNIIVIKLTGIKRHNIEKYYNQLQKTIGKIQSIKKQFKRLKRKKSLKKQKKKVAGKKDFFKVFLNPKKVKKILEQEYQKQEEISKNMDNQQNDSNNNFQFIRSDALGDKSLNKMKQIKQKQNSQLQQINQSQKQLQYRKKLAMNTQYQIKNQRAKYNIWKMKRSLFQQGIITKYTYNMISPQGASFESIRQLDEGTQRQIIFEGQMNQKMYCQQQNQENDDNSDQLQSNTETMNNFIGNDDNQADKAQDNQTFNSATSSAAFISMTNSIKMFKMKLRSLNTPKLLYWLNIGFVLMVCLMVGFGLCLWMEQGKRIKWGGIYFQKAIESTWIIDSALMAKIYNLKIEQIKHYATDLLTLPQITIPSFSFIRDQYSNLMHSILSTHFLKYSQYLMSDPELLRYLFFPIKLNQTYSANIQHLQILQFILRQYDYLKLNQNVKNQIQIRSLLNIHSQTFIQNIFYNYLNKLDSYLFYSTLLILTFMLLLTLPIVYKIQSKVKQIIYLISKISIHQRKRYYLQFIQLKQQLKQMNQTDNWIGLEQVHEVKSKNIIGNIKIQQLNQNNRRDNQRLGGKDLMKSHAGGDQNQEEVMKLLTNNQSSNPILNNGLYNTTHSPSSIMQNIQQTKIAINNDNIVQDQQMGSLEANKKSHQQINKITINKSKSKIKMLTEFPKTIYFKILIIYFVFLIVFIGKYLKVKFSYDKFILQNKVFTKILSQKLIFTQSSLLFNQFLTQPSQKIILQYNQMLYNLKQRNLNIIETIYDSYHLNLKEYSSIQPKTDYQKFVNKLTTGNTCQMIIQQIEKYSHSNKGTGQFYISFLKLVNKIQDTIIHKQISYNQPKQCTDLNNGSLTKGLFTTLQYLHQKRKEYILLNYTQRMQYLSLKNSTNNKFQPILQLQKIHHYTNIVIFILENYIKKQTIRTSSKLLFQMLIGLIILLITLILFSLLWAWIYLNIAQRASYINAFLLLIPYDVLSQNPYIKLYIKNQFDYKAAVY